MASTSDNNAMDWEEEPTFDLGLGSDELDNLYIDVPTFNFDGF